PKCLDRHPRGGIQRLVGWSAFSITSIVIIAATLPAFLERSCSVRFYRSISCSLTTLEPQGTRLRSFPMLPATPSGLVLQLGFYFSYSLEKLSEAPHPSQMHFR